MALNWLNFKYPLAVSFIKPLIRRWLKAGRRPNWFKESGHGISSAGIEFFCLHRLGLQFNLKIFRFSFWINLHKLTAKNSNVDRCGSGRSERQTSPIAHQLQHVAAGGTGTGVPGQSLPGRLHARGPGHAARPQGVASCCKSRMQISSISIVLPIQFSNWNMQMSGMKFRKITINRNWIVEKLQNGR